MNVPAVEELWEREIKRSAAVIANPLSTEEQIVAEVDHLLTLKLLLDGDGSTTTLRGILE
jgi:hypothetical protein